jgi:hypothetical protein
MIPASWRRAYGLLPRDVFVRVEDQRTPGNLEPEAWAALRRVLDIIQAANAGGRSKGDLRENRERVAC